MKKKIPPFKSDEEEARFWETHSTADYWEGTAPADNVKFERAPREVVTLRLDPHLIRRLKAIAEAKGIGFTTLIRMVIVEHCGDTEKAPTTPRRQQA